MFEDSDFPSDATLTLKAIRIEDHETPRPDQVVTSMSEEDTLAQSIVTSDMAVTGLSEDTPAQSKAAFEVAVEPSKSLSKMTEQKKKVIQKPNEAGSAHGDPRVAEAALLRMRCSQLGVSVFFNKQAPVRSLGFTSPIHGEGKSFLALLTAQVMAYENNIPVTLLECNWEHPCFADTFNLGNSFGLAEWLQGKCSREAMRQPVSRNLTIIPAGDGKQDAVKLLHQFREAGALDVLERPEEVLIIDLPSTATTAYGPLAASLAEALVMVVRMGVTSHTVVEEACTYLKDLPVLGIVLNNIESHVPGWLRQLL
jgi:Mrp family chromosome partitioning ATPase